MDIIAAIASILAIITNAAGINGAVMNGLRAAGSIGRYQVQRFRIWLGTRLARYLASFMRWAVAGMVGVTALVVLTHILRFVYFDYSLTSEDEPFYVRGLPFIITGAIHLATVAVGGVLMLRSASDIARWGTRRFQLDANGQPVIEQITVGGRTVNVPLPHADYKPLRVSFFRATTRVTVSVMLVSITLLIHALAAESQALVMLSLVTVYSALIVAAVMLGMAALIIRKGVGFAEKATQTLVEPFAALTIAGVTLKNAAEKLFAGKLQFLEEEKWAPQLALVASALVVVLTPYYIILIIWPTFTTAILAGIGYFVALSTGWAAKKIGLTEMVKKSSQRLFGILFTWGKWIAILTAGGFTLIVNAIPDSWILSLYTFRIGGGADFWEALGIILIAVIVAGALVGIASMLPKDKVRGFRWAVNGLAFVAIMSGLATCATATGLAGDPFEGIMAPAEAKTVDQKITVTDPVTRDVGAGSMELEWTTDKPAVCKVLIVDVDEPKKADEPELDRGDSINAIRSTNGLTHKATLRGIPGCTQVKYRVMCFHSEGEHFGKRSTSPDFLTCSGPAPGKVCACLVPVPATPPPVSPPQPQKKTTIVVPPQSTVVITPPPPPPKIVVQPPRRTSAPRDRVDVEFDALAERVGVE